MYQAGLFPIMVCGLPTATLATKVIDDKNVQVIIGTNIQFVHDELKANM